MHSPPMVENIHQAFEHYNLLDVRLLQDTTQLNIPGAKAWRMNLCALSERDPTIAFTAVDNNILVYHTTHFSGQCGSPIKQLVTRPNETEEQHTINQIKLARLFDEEALVAVTEAGEIWVWRTDQLDIPPIVLNNNGSSTWGVAIHSGQGLIAVSANNYTVTVFNMQSVPAAVQMFGQRRPNIPPIMDDNVDMVQLIGHQGNIPCVDFNHSGRFVASCSIDQTCRIWDVKTGRQVTERQFSINRIDRNYWCWSVKFVSLRDFKSVECATEKLRERLSRRVNQDRPTSLQSVDLRHSAPNPIYRVNLPDLDSGPTFQEEFIESELEDGYTDDEEPVQLDDEAFQRLSVDPIQQLHLMGDIYQTRIFGEVDLPIVVRGNDGATEDGEERQGADSHSLWRTFQQTSAHQWSQGAEVDMPDIIPGNEGPTEDDDDQSSGRSDTDVSSGNDGAISQTPLSEEQAYQDAETDFETQEMAYSIDMSNHDTDGDHDVDLGPNLLANWDPNDIDIDSDWFDEGDDEDAVFMQLGPHHGHQLLSAEDHRNLREQLQSERWSLHRAPIPTVQPIPVSTKGGWSDTEDESEDDTSAITNALEEDEEDEVPTHASVVPLVMQSSFLSIDSVTSKKKKKKRGLIERLVVTTPKDLFLLRTNVGSMVTERLERGIISNVDVRSDRMLVSMDRLNMVQWIPELELFICASQKGTIALVRMLCVKLGDGNQTIMFNHERYLPDHGMQSKSLYGLSAQRIHEDRGSSPVYILYLFYYDGVTLSYRISRQNDELFADPLVI